jgi:hypothetical protein
VGRMRADRRFLGIRAPLVNELLTFCHWLTVVSLARMPKRSLPIYSKPLSVFGGSRDGRKRVVAAVLNVGLSRNEAAKTVAWCDGSARPEAWRPAR